MPKRRSDRYAAFFVDPAGNRDLEERGIGEDLAASLRFVAGMTPYAGLRSRGLGEDPPDCEAMDDNGKRIAIEVTELVDQQAVETNEQMLKATLQDTRPRLWAPWNLTKFETILSERLQAKDDKFLKLKGSPYPGGYIVIIHTDEADLSKEIVEAYLREVKLPACTFISRVFLLISYSPDIGRCPVFELDLSR